MTGAVLLGALLACGGVGAPPAEPATALEQQRRVVRSAEEGLLWRQAHDALAGGAHEDAARAIDAGMRLAPGRFSPLIDALVPLLEPAVAAQLVRDPGQAAQLRREAEQQQVQARYREGGSPLRLEGVTAAHGRAVLEGVRREYVEAPDEAAMGAGAWRRLSWITEALGIAGALGDPPDDATVQAAIAAAIAVGLPEAVAVAEGVEGALAALDPHTRPVWPAEIAGWSQHHEGIGVGVGLTLLDAPDGSVWIDVPLSRGPAWGSGLRQGDVLVQIDAVQIAALPEPRAGVAAALLQGEAGSPVTLAVRRGQDSHEVRLVRGAWVESTVSGWERAGDNAWVPWIDEAQQIAFVRIEGFRPGTDEDFDALLQGITPRAVILDLRGNPGGDVMAAVNVADRFVEGGILAALVGRAVPAPEAGEGEVPWNVALPGHALEGVAPIVLLDGHTASAAELLAGALQQRAGAILVGEESFGKGLSQGLRADEAVGVAWQVTTGAWALPSGALLEAVSGAGGGLRPDVAVPLSAAETFLVGVQRRRREHLRTHADGTPIRFLGTRARADLPRLSADPQVMAALAEARRLVGRP